MKKNLYNVELIGKNLKITILAEAFSDKKERTAEINWLFFDWFGFRAAPANFIISLKDEFIDEFTYNKIMALEVERNIYFSDFTEYYNYSDYILKEGREKFVKYVQMKRMAMNFEALKDIGADIY